MSASELVGLIARTAGMILLEFRGSGLFDGKALGKAADAVNRFMMSALKHFRPGDAILSIESHFSGHVSGLREGQSSWPKTTNKARSRPRAE